MKRPDGVTILAVWHFVLAFFGLAGACVILALPVPAILSETGGNDTLYALAGVGIGLFFSVLFGVVALLAGWGLLRLKEWARWLAIALAIVSLFAVPIGTIIGAATIWYLLQPGVRQAFQPAAPPPLQE